MAQQAANAQWITQGIANDYGSERWRDQQLAAQQSQIVGLEYWESRVVDFAADRVRFAACVRSLWSVLLEMVLL